MKKLLLLVVTLVLLLLMSTGVQAQEKYRINVYTTFGDLYVPAGYDFELRAGWAACTPGLVRAYQQNFNLDVTMNGEPLTDSYWSPIEPYPYPLPQGGECIAAPKGDLMSATQFNYPLGVLEPGVYEFSGDAFLDHKITDGYDQNEDGKPDFFEGLLASIDFTLIVEAP